MAKNSNRYLLTYQGAGHRIGLGPAPEEMRQRLWDLDWFEDPVWRQDRIVGINLHFITAFLDRYVKDDASRASYLDGLTRRVRATANGRLQPATLTARTARARMASRSGRDSSASTPKGLELLHESPR